MPNLLKLAEAVCAPWEILGAPEATEACDEDAVRAVFEGVDGFDVIHHSLAQWTIGKPELITIDRAQEFQGAFLGVDGDNPVSRDEWMGAHDLVWLGLRCDSLRQRSSQRGLVAAFVGTVGMALTGARSQGKQVQEFPTTVLAGVSGFLTAFVESMLALVRSGGVSLAWAAGEGADGGGLAATVFAVEVSHDGVWFGL
jgi:hypothetical protein